MKVNELQIWGEGWILTVGVEHFAGESHLGGAERVVRRETQNGWKHAPLKARVFGAPGTETGKRGVSGNSREVRLPPRSRTDYMIG